MCLVHVGVVFDAVIIHFAQYFGFSVASNDVMCVIKTRIVAVEFVSIFFYFLVDIIRLFFISSYWKVFTVASFIHDSSGKRELLSAREFSIRDVLGCWQFAMPLKNNAAKIMFLRRSRAGDLTFCSIHVTTCNGVHSRNYL